MEIRNKLYIGTLSLTREHVPFPAFERPLQDGEQEYLLMLDDEGDAYAYMLDENRFQHISTLCQGDFEINIGDGEWVEIGIVI